MPRINFEDEIFRDRRFIKLVSLCGGDLDTALGSIVFAWCLAQKWWLSPHKKIPLPEWEKQGLRPAIIESGMAVIEGDFVYVRGSKEQFAWLDQRSEAGRKGGINSAAAKNRSKGKTLVMTDNSAEREPAGSSGFNPPSLSLSQEELIHMAGKPAHTELEKVYGEYPKRLGDQKKSVGLKRLAKEIKTPADMQALQRAVTNYRNHCDATEKTGTEYVKQFATWVSNWREWAEINVKPAAPRTRVVNPDDIEAEFNGTR